MSNLMDEGGRPFFLYSVPYRDPLSEELAEFFGAHDDSIAFGLIGDLSSKGPQAILRSFGAYPNVPVRIADPMLHRIDAPFVEEARTSQWGKEYKARVPRPGAGWDSLLAQEIPVSARVDSLGSAIWSTRPDSSDADARAAWVALQLQVQRSAGATLLLSAGGWVTSVGAQGAIKRAMIDIAHSRAAIGPGDTLVCALTLHHQWLANPGLLSALLTEIRSSDEPHWYLRFLAPKTATGAQVLASDVLAGLSALIAAFREEGKTVILPDLDLLGLVAVIQGAAGFSTTTSASRRYYTPSGGGAPGEKERVFEPEILRVVTRAPAEALRSRPRSPRYFETPFHQAIDAAGFDKIRSKYDHVASVAVLLAEVAVPTGRADFIERLQQGATLADQYLDKGTEDYPGHLVPWRDVLTA